MSGGSLPRRPFGRTGHHSSRVIFGAAALATASQEQADRLLEVLLRFGVNHLDTAAAYGDAEVRMAPWLRRHPGRFFVATKTGERSGSGARAGLERSLERLGVDRVDLVQLHNLVEPDEWAEAHAPGGAVEALAAARDEGLVRFVGVTGHGLRIAAAHLRSLERFDFDSVLFPYSPVLTRHPAYRADVEQLIDLCAQRGTACQAIKAVARRRWPEGADAKGSWYEPMSDPGAIERAVRFVLSRPELFLVSSSNWNVLEPVLRAAVDMTAGGDPPPPPDARGLDQDLTGHEVSPLFDGAVLDRI